MIHGYLTKYFRRIYILLIQILTMGKLLIIIFVLLLVVTGALAFNTKISTGTSYNGSLGIGTSSPTQE